MGLCLNKCLRSYTKIRSDRYFVRKVPGVSDQRSLAGIAARALANTGQPVILPEFDGKEAIVLYSDRKPIAFALYKDKEHTPRILTDVYVDLGFQHQGFGTYLIFLTLTNCNMLEVNVPFKNTPMVSLITKLKFQIASQDSDSVRAAISGISQRSFVLICVPAWIINEFSLKTFS